MTMSSRVLRFWWAVHSSLERFENLRLLLKLSFWMLILKACRAIPELVLNQALNNGAQAWKTYKVKIGHGKLDLCASNVKFYYQIV